MKILADWLGALGDEHVEGFGPAMQWLVEHPAEARPALRALLDENRNDMATRRAFDVLGRIGDVDDVPAIAARLASAHGTLAADAAHGLALHRRTEARDALITATAHLDPDVAGAAASALGERGDPSARPILERLLAHADDGVRHRAKLALEELSR